MEYYICYFYWFNRWNRNREDLIMKVFYFLELWVILIEIIYNIIYFYFYSEFEIYIYKELYYIYIEG